MNQGPQSPFPPGMNLPFDPGQMEKMKRELKRRAGLFALGLVIVIVGALIDPKPNDWPIYTPTMVMMLGGGVGLMGLLGLARGAGCMAQVAAFFWILGIACNIGATNQVTQFALAGAVLCYVTLALLLPKKPPGPPGMQGAANPFAGFPGFGAPRPGSQIAPSRGGRPSVIEVDATEKKSE